MRRTGGVLSSLLAAVLAVGCTALQPPPNRAQEAELVALRSRLRELERRAVVAEVELARLREQLAESGVGMLPVVGREARSEGRGATGVERDEDAPRPSTRAPAEAAPPEAPAGDAGAADIESDDIEVEAVSVEPPQPSSPSEPAQPSAEGERQAGRPAASAATTAAGATRLIGPDGQAIYDQGYTEYHQGRFADAETTFRRFLEAYGDTDLADNATYWIGQSRLERGEVQGALEAFRQTVTRYPDGNKVPEALLSAGRCLEQLGDLDSARVTYQELMSRYPNTAASELARSRLSEIE